MANKQTDNSQSGEDSSVQVPSPSVDTPIASVQLSNTESTPVMVPEPNPDTPIASVQRGLTSGREVKD